MGILARRMEEGVRFNAGEWLVADDGMETGRQTPSGVRVTDRVALGLTTVWRCVDLLTSAVSQAPKDIIVKVGGKSFPEFTKPAWLIAPDPTRPTYTINDYFAQVALSLLLDGNFFVWAYPDIFDPIVLKVLPPAQVDVPALRVYQLRDAQGHVTAEFGPNEILHGTWILPAGALRGISPLESLRRAIGNAVAAEDHAGRFFGQGAALSFGVEVPGTLTPDQKKDMAENLRARYAGAANSHAIGVLTAGAKFVSGLTPTPEQAQMLATRKFSVEDLCRPYGVPPNMAGSQEPGASSYASADIWREEFRDYAALPLATRIEAHHNRLIQVPDNIADPNATAQFKFNLDHVARTNILTRYQAYGEGVTKGFITPNEARVTEDRPPVTGGDELYMLQQMVPISDLGRTKATEPLDTQPRPAGDASRSVADDSDVRSVVMPAFHFADGAFQMQAQLPAMTLAPQMTFETPAPPDLTPVFERLDDTLRAVAERPAPIVNVVAPSVTRKIVKRDEHGQISAIVEG